jgi:hypothetical protein
MPGDPRLHQQRTRLLLGEHAGLATAAQAEKFLAGVAIALRYGASDALPLASMYQAVWSQARGEAERDAQRRATVLTNALIERGAAVETNAIADRVTIVHASLVPALIALRRRGAGPDELALSDTARRVLAFVIGEPRPTAGQVRAYLGVPPRTWPNPADDALAELQRCLLIDRGAAEVPDAGAPYLAKDGIPYRAFDRTHPALVRAAAALTVGEAASRLVAAYLGGAVFAQRSKLASMFKHCVSRAELDAAIAALAADRRVEVDGKAVVAARVPRRSPVS